MNPISETRGVILMLLSIVFFTVNTLAVRALALHFPACDGWQVTFFRGIAGTVLVLILFKKGQNLRMRSLVDRPKIVARGILGASGVVLFYITIIHLGPARAVVINLTYPIFAALLAAVVLNEPLSSKKLAWIFIGFVGLVIFVGPKALDGGLTIYDLLAVVGALLSAGVVVLIRTLHRSEHTSTIFASQAVYSLIIALPFSISSSTSIPSIGILGLVLAGLVAAGGQLAMTFAYRHLDVSKGASMQMILPIATATGAWFFFNETLGAVEITGAAFTLLATVMVNRQTSKPLHKMPSNFSPNS